MEFDFSQAETRDEVYTEPSRLLPAVLVSLLFHGLLAGVFINRQIASPIPAESAVVSVRLYPSNPMLDKSMPAEIEAELLPSGVTEDLTLVEATDEVNELEDLTESEPELNELAESQPSSIAIDEDPASTNSSSPSKPTAEFNLPSVLTVQESLRSFSAESKSAFYVRPCNPLEEEAGIRDCETAGQGDDQRSYQVNERNSTYRALNPTRQLSRAERSLDTVSTQSKALAGRLGDLNLSKELSDYVLEELEAGITHNANLGNRAVDHMVNSNDKSAAGAMARELLSDPWVINKTKQRAQRQVNPPN